MHWRGPLRAIFAGDLLEPQRIGERVGDQRFRQSMSFAVRSRATARAN
jgi:hypothetical protein